MNRRTAVLTRGVFPHQFAWLLHLPLRRLIVSPKRLVDQLPLQEHSRVLEVGPGSGYFSTELARRLPSGVLCLLDLQPQMLVKARRRLTSQGYRHVQYVAADAAALPFPDAQFDVALLVCVLGEVSRQDDGIASLARVLTPVGTLAVRESVPDPDRIEFNTLEALVRRHGFQLAARHGGRFSYTALFRRDAAIRQHPGES